MKREPKKMKKTCSRTDNPNAELAKQFSGNLFQTTLTTFLFRLTSNYSIELGDFEKAKRDGFFKYNAYRKAARVIMDYPEKIVSGKSAQKNMVIS